jgi:hypothetical protein
MAAELSGQEQRQATPAAADIQHPLAAAQPQLAGDDVQVRFLGVIQRIVLAGEERAGVLHVAAKECLEELSWLLVVDVRGLGGFGGIQLR